MEIKTGDTIENGETGYEELYAQMLRLIPIYSNEWTNFNNADPAITILQSLTQLAVWQNNAIDQPNSEIAQKLLELLSLKTTGYSSATVTVGVLGQSANLPIGTRLLSGDCCYELAKAQELYSGNPILLFSKNLQYEKKLSHLLNSDIVAFIYPFGEKADIGTEFYMGFDMPIYSGETLEFYLDFHDELKARVPFTAENAPVFAQIKWEYYTENGFIKADVHDETFSFMRSGIISVEIKSDMQKFNISGQNGFFVRATLLKQDYDSIPKLSNIFCNPIIFSEQRTLARYMLFEYNSNLTNEYYINISDADEFIPLMLIRCTDNFWRRCEFSKEVYSKNEIALSLILPSSAENCKNFSPFSPIDGENSVKIILYQAENANRMELSTMYGYDAQRMELPSLGIVSTSFETMAALKDKDGSIVFIDEKNDDYSYKYHIDSRKSELIMDNVPFGEDNRLFIVSCAVTTGIKGNIRPQELKNAQCPQGTVGTVGTVGTEKITVTNSTQGEGGADPLSIRDLRGKLLHMLRNPEIPVANDDYERLVREIPGLCIDRVCAYSNENESTVKIAVRPISDKRFESLSPVYIKAIKGYFESHKLITTRIEVVKPIYLPIDIYISLHVKPYATNAEETIKTALSQEVDYYESGCDFACVILYNKLYSSLEQLDCVSYIESMKIDADTSYGQASIDGNNIRLSKRALPYLRNVEMKMM